MLKGVTITCNYDDDTTEAAVPTEMTIEMLSGYIAKLIREEPDMTSFVVVAVVSRD